MSDTPTNSPPLDPVADGYAKAAAKIAGGIPAGSGWSLSDGQVTDLINQLHAAGVPKEKILEAAAADGYDVLLEDDPGDKRSSGQREFDASSLGEATDLAQFQIAWFGRAVQPSPELTQALGLHVLDKAGFSSALDRGLRNGLMAMQFPPLAGGPLVQDGLDGMRRYSEMTAAQKPLWEAQQSYDLHAVTGNAASAQLDARLMIDRWHQTNPKLVDALAKAGFFKFARVQAQLAAQAQRLYARAELANSK